MARGFAVLGMLAAHVGPDSIDSIVAGRDAALFAVLAGVSIALLSGGANPPRGRSEHLAGVRITARALLLVPLGLALSAMTTSVDNILPFYGLFFLLALPALRLRTRGLVVAAAVLAVLGPVLSYALRSQYWPLSVTSDGYGLLPDFSTFVSGRTLATLLFLGTYPAASFMAFVFAGMAVGRADLRRPELVGKLLPVGAGLAVFGYGGSWLALHPFGALNQILGSVPSANHADVLDWVSDPSGMVPTTDPAWLLTSGPHSGTPFEIAGCIGVALISMSACLLLARSRRGRAVLTPLSNLGAMVLTGYSLQIVLIAVLGSDRQGGGAWLALLVFSGVLLLFATAWRRAGRLGRRGPLEAVLHVFSTKTAHALVPMEVKSGRTAVSAET